MEPEAQQATGGGVAAAPAEGAKKHSLKDTVSKYVNNIKEKLHRHKKGSSGANDTTKAQEQGELPQYDIYGIGTQPTPAEVEAHRQAEERAQASANGPTRLMYPMVVPIDTIRVPLDSNGQPILNRVALKFDNISKTYTAALLEDPAICTVPAGEGTHEFTALPRYVQFRAKDTLGRDIMLYSNTYCRACGLHSLVLKV